METLLLVLLGLLAGAGVPVQAAVNSALRQHLGRPEWATLVSFGTGTALVSLALILQRTPLPAMAQVSRAPWWAWTGGGLGAFYVFTIILLVPRLGAASALVITLAGQVVFGLLLDRAGVLGLATRELTPGRLAGVALLAAGVFLIQR
jgi:transporter family-2 protein